MVQRNDPPMSVLQDENWTNQNAMSTPQNYNWPSQDLVSSLHDDNWPNQNSSNALQNDNRPSQEVVQRMETPTIKPASPQSSLLTSGELTQTFLNSCSRPNFAKRLCAMLFSEDIRKVSNVGGGKKKKLCPTTIDYIHQQSFIYWPLQLDEKKEKDEWAACVIAIDEGNRCLNRVKCKSASARTSKSNK